MYKKNFEQLRNLNGKQMRKIPAEIRGIKLSHAVMSWRHVSKLCLFTEFCFRFKQDEVYERKAFLRKQKLL